ncbi:16S rRNA C1402 N4-methylase RsmH [Sedimentibacter acidaminivorans]|uniref:16S rRNA C1402 N4-methylase RsmH n=1 Tax=Sedimentibacter acidaminivorans TaxID=913099 RepID=A0ABS4GCI2_9FIRM|nr:class I SAM-dependent methyltransferase [Sedimentibacter acidaminivorans]MBP1925403.1 16S rRNA C1402 N4-methylase RsmH [Sedimentibacter acidaminivorans]
MNNIKYGKVVDFVHMLIRQSYEDKSELRFVDATCGNGFDALFLSKVAGESGKVFAFDIQDQAIERTTTLLETNSNFKNYEIIKDSHELINKYMSEKIDAALFNLGYLPFSDKEVTTQPDVTVNALKNLLFLLKENGRVYITTYISHDTGKEIKEIKQFLKDLSKKEYNVIHMKIINKDNAPPELFIIEKTEKQ